MHIGTLLKENFRNLTRGFESQVHLLIRNDVATHKEFISKEHTVEHYGLYIECAPLLGSLWLLHHFIFQILIHVRFECAQTQHHSQAYANDAYKRPFHSFVHIILCLL